MSFFKKLFGGKSFADHVAEADDLFEDERWADARQAYERALDAGGDASEEQRERCDARMRACLDELAKAMIEEADRLLDAGDVDLAEAELRNAMELADDAAIAKQARRRLETLEKQDALRQAEGPEELSDDDRWAVLAGTWEDAQIDEYDDYGDAFRDALLALHDQEVEAGEALEAILEEADEPVYLWLEVSRARALAEDFEGAEEALRAFLDALDEDEGGQMRLGAYVTLAALRERADDEEGALAELGEAMERYPENPGPFLAMGQYLLGKGHAGEAVEVLEAGADLLDPDRPDWRFLEELGLAYVAADEPGKAGEVLDQVIAFFVSLRRPDRPLDLPVRAAVARAELFEAAGRLEKAADLYRTLSGGSDVESHLHYHREAARLLLELELDDEARRMLTRALALAEGDEEASAAIEAQLAELE